MTWFKRSTWVTLSAGNIMLGLWAFIVATGTSSGAPTARTGTVWGYAKTASAGNTAQPVVTPLGPTLSNPHYQWALAHPQLPPETVVNLKSLKAADTGGRLQIGLGRAFDQPLVVNADTAPAADWTLLPNGWRIWSIDVASVGAQGLRIHLDSLALPAGARIVVYDPANPSTPSRPITAASLAGAKDYWVETLLAERVIVECQVPPGADTRALSLAVAGVSHIYQLPPVPGATNEKAASCENDATCFPAFAQEAKAIARIGFVSGGNAFLCTGFLIADSNSGSTQNFFMTANHCVGNQATASTMEFWWMYQSASCNGTPPSISSVPHTSGGATLLASGTQSDFSFSQLRQAPPAGSFFLGWSLSAPSGGESLTTLHHPGGIALAISFGREVNTDGNFWNVQWSSGVTENGSSGGPLLDASHLVIGQLMGGASACSNPSGIDSFGRFDVSYPNFQQFLSGGGGSSNAVGFVNGTYMGLFSDPTNGVSSDSAGNLTLTTTAKGKFTGSFRLGPTRFSVHGAFDGTGNADVTTTTKAFGSIEVQLALDPNDSDHISGAVNTAVWSSSFDAFRNVFDGHKSIAFEAGRYTIDIPGNPNATDQPNGDSFATATVTKAGRVSVTGTMADGTKFSQSATISKDGQWPFYVPVYASQGLLFSWVLFTNSDTADLGGSVNWIKPSQPHARFYPNGFSTTLNVTGCTYAKPPGGSTILNFTDANVTFSGGALNQNFVNAIAIDTNSRVFNQSSNSLKMTFSVSSGTFTGRVQDPNTGLTVPFSGIVLQKPNTASGFFQESGLSGNVSIVGASQ